jgi:acetyl esterase/lipase
VGIRLNCRCGRSLHLRDDLAGLAIRCPQCRKILQVPDGWLQGTEADEGVAAPATQGRSRRAASGTAGFASSLGRIFVALVTSLVFLLGYFYVAGVVRSRSGGVSETSGTDSYRPPPVDSKYGFNSETAGSVPAVPTGLQPGKIPVPRFSELGRPVMRFPGGQLMYSVQAQSGGSIPGGDMQMFVYLPAELPRPATLPCVLVAPAGTILLTGNGVTDDYHKEALPYVEAGCVVVRYSLDGSVDDMDNPAQLEAGIQAFMKAEGGTVNGRNALEYVLQNLPHVNPRKIFVAGHSSAGTVALCMAAVEPRLAGCIAYAACADPEARLRDGLVNNGPAYALLMQFLAATSPMKHASEIKCPVMVFHALDDSNVAYSEAQNYVATLKSAGVETHFVTAASGDHYQPMIDEGIPAGIRWLLQQ